MHIIVKDMKYLYLTHVYNSDEVFFFLLKKILEDHGLLVKSYLRISPYLC